MASITTTKTINLQQLTTELGVGMSARSVTGLPLELEADLPLEVLQVAIDAHVADPFYGEAAEDRTLRLARVQAQAVLAGTATYTALESQRILARLVLRATRS